MKNEDKNIVEILPDTKSGNSGALNTKIVVDYLTNPNENTRHAFDKLLTEFIKNNMAEQTK